MEWKKLIHVEIFTWTGLRRVGNGWYTLVEKSVLNADEKRGGHLGPLVRRNPVASFCLTTRHSHGGLWCIKVGNRREKGVFSSARHLLPPCFVSDPPILSPQGDQTPKSPSVQTSRFYNVKHALKLIWTQK